MHMPQACLLRNRQQIVLHHLLLQLAPDTAAADLPLY
jgi:hypothetical protein